MLQEIINNLGEKIEKSLSSSDLEKIFVNLEKINSHTILCGVGGSRVVSTFFEKVLSRKNNIIARNIDVEEYFLGNFDNYYNLILVSHSGKNHGVKCLSYARKNKYLFTTRKRNISDEVLLKYSVEDRIKSFISLDDTFIPLSILLCYYLDSYKLSFPKNFIADNFEIMDFKDANIIYDYNSKVCATFLETSFVEAGISSVTMHTKYSLCHGRSNLISNKESLVIYLVTNESELDVTLIRELQKISKNFLVLKDSSKDPVIADYNLTIRALYFLNYLSKRYHMEFVKVKYNEIVPTIYNFKGELI